MDINTSSATLSVSQITTKIKNYLENSYRFVRIIGEISNLKTPFSGHSYFTLKDDSAQLQAVLFKQRKRFVDTVLEDGIQVVCFGQITVYEPRGSYQLVVDSVEPAGSGKLQIEFEALKKKLAEQGYFDEQKKQPIPRFPQKIAVISSPTGAAFADFLKIVQLRGAGVHIQLYPTRVQGEKAPEEIANAIQELDRLQQHDVLVLIRGGGSLEDLQAFNDKRVADAVFQASLPVVSGIGHQIDFTITDFCADQRCPTPTAAAEFLIADRKVLRRQLDIQRNRLVSTIRNQIEKAEQQLQYCRYKLLNSAGQLTRARHQLQLRHAHLISSIATQLTTTEKQLQHYAYRLQLCSPHKQIATAASRLTTVKQQLSQAIRYILQTNQHHLEAKAVLLNSVSPLATMSRGYSITRKRDTQQQAAVIRSAQEVCPGESVEILLYQGTLHCLVKSCEQENNPAEKRKNSQL